VVSDVPGGLARLARRARRTLDRLARDVELARRTAARELLDRMPIAVARGEIHPRIDAGGILREGVLDQAHRLDERAPVECGKFAQAADAVADQHLVGGLATVLAAHLLLDRQARFGEVLLDPAERQCERRAASL